jgi:hypothetical protein
MTDDNVQSMIDALRISEADLTNQLKDLADSVRQAESKLDKTRSAIASLQMLLDDDPIVFSGLTDAVRAVLKKQTKPLAPTEVRDELKLLGYNLAQHRNEKASIHSVLKRLAESPSKDVRTRESKDGTRYYWAGEPDPLVIKAKPLSAQDKEAARQALM